MHEAEVPGAVIGLAECGDGAEGVSSGHSCWRAFPVNRAGRRSVYCSAHFSAQC